MVIFYSILKHNVVIFYPSFIYLHSVSILSNTVDVYRHKTIESIGKNFVTLVLKFYKSYKVFSYRFFRYPTTVNF